MSLNITLMTIANYCFDFKLSIKICYLLILREYLFSVPFAYCEFSYNILLSLFITQFQTFLLSPMYLFHFFFVLFPPFYKRGISYLANDKHKYFVCVSSMYSFKDLGIMYRILNRSGSFNKTYH